MIRSLTFGVLLAGVLTGSQAGILVTSEQSGQQAQQYFERGAFMLMEGGTPRFGVDRTGDCWFILQGQLVVDPCDRMLDAMHMMREQAMAALGPGGRAMVEEILQMPGIAQAAQIAASGGKMIAGYSAECHKIGNVREVCLSADLMREIQEEMGDSQLVETFQRFSQSAAEFAGGNAQAEALAELYQRGFPMLDIQQAQAGPVINPAMLAYLPEARRAQVMQRFSAGASGAQMQVIRVQQGVAMPEPDLAGYPRIGFDEFVGQVGSMFLGR